jgi:hypothetical protein
MGPLVRAEDNRRKCGRAKHFSDVGDAVKRGQKLYAAPELAVRAAVV